MIDSEGQMVHPITCQVFFESACRVSKVDFSGDSVYSTSSTGFEWISENPDIRRSSGI